MILSIAFIFAGALLAPVIDKILKKRTGIGLSIIPLAVFFYLIHLFRSFSDGNTVRSSISWVEELNISISFYTDGLSLLFAFLVVGIGFFVLVYSGTYMKDKKLTGRYYSYMLLFMGSMLGLVTSDNLIGLYVFWELTSVSSYMLIIQNHHKDRSRAAGFQALLVTALGGLAAMAGFILIGSATGSYELSVLLESGADMSSHRFYVPVVVLILLGAFTKSAQFPFHFWLPTAMVAPTPVSAYLHSAAMVNAGLYLVARLNPLLGNTDLWQITIISTGLITMFIGAYFSLTQKDLKRILAYATVSALGILMLLLGIGTVLAVKAAMLYLVVHALYKATLFMVAGTIDEKTGTRNIYLLGNLWKKMPLTTVAALLALASMASLPPMMGYISKKLIFEAKVQFLDNAPYLLIFGFIAFVFLFAVSILVAWQVFFRKEKEAEKKPHEGGVAFLLGPVILALLSFVMAIFPEQFERFFEFAAEEVKGRDIKVELKLWHGFTKVLWLSLLSMALGALLFVFRKKIIPAFQHINKYLERIELAELFQHFIGGLLHFTKKITGFIQHGYHRFYLLIVFITTGAFLWLNLLFDTRPDFELIPSSVSVPVMAIVLITVLASLVTIITKSKITAIIATGVVGYSLAVFFLINGAVDLAITFIIVDTLTLVLFVMVTLKLPGFSGFSGKSSRIRDAIVAVFVGGSVFMIALVASLSEDISKVSDTYLAKSLPEGLGKNVVNVILVDFRALDTLGEISVLLIAAVSIYSLLKFKTRKK